MYLKKGVPGRKNSQGKGPGTGVWLRIGITRAAGVRGGVEPALTRCTFPLAARGEWPVGLRNEQRSLN